MRIIWNTELFKHIVRDRTKKSVSAYLPTNTKKRNPMRTGDTAGRLLLSFFYPIQKLRSEPKMDVSINKGTDAIRWSWNRNIKITWRCHMWQFDSSCFCKINKILPPAQWLTPSPSWWHLHCTCLNADLSFGWHGRAYLLCEIWINEQRKYEARKYTTAWSTWCAKYAEKHCSISYFIANYISISTE